MRLSAAAATSSSQRGRTSVVVVALLFATVLAVLAFESSLLDTTQAAVPWRSSTIATESTVEVAKSLAPGDQEVTDEDVPSEDRLHLSLLQAACLANGEAIVPWTFGKPGADQQNDEANQKTLITRDDPELLAKLRQCPDVDIFLPFHLRGHGYCEDAIAYAKFLESRLLPIWAIDIPLFDPELNRTVTYHELCPKTPILLFNHYWDGVPTAPAFPKSKPVYMMPNIEMYELNEKHWWNVDVVLCKTHSCYDRVTKWYKQEGNKRNSKVFYTRHTTSDVANLARMHLGDDNIKPKDFKNVRFLHAVGGSSHKGTQQVLDCWLTRPDFPPLDLFIAEGNYKSNFETAYGNRIHASQINLTSHNLEPLTFGKVIAEASFFLCTSRMEGYGHYINQARASGGVILTSDTPPMNELIQANGMGVYVAAQHVTDPNQFLGGAYHGAMGLRDVDGMVAHVTPEAVCRAVEQVVYNTTVWGRQAMATKAQQQYHIDTKFFAKRMLELRQFAKEGSSTGTTRLRREPIGS